ncbi:hypothetical protein TNIN_477501 [Trichonephila inaurata madagascariensis]|uniref:Uncharacterized protein n=1 Tax=Trichonephila inaurata madagascariensis TaxID=2747483 RepID=A0A8X7BPZ3_9ARAC|nr:hypothetical protein TNIN_477501 [Trichonephila inaurata madagascariensis]
MILYAWADTEKEKNTLLKFEGRTEHARHLDREYKGKNSASSEFGKDDVSKDKLRNQAAMENDNFSSFEERNIEDKYSYSPGGFYVPSAKKVKLNYFVEELDAKSTHSQSKRLESDKKSPTEMEAKEMKILTGAPQTETQVTKKPSLMSLVRNMMLNPMALSVILLLPLAVVAQMFFLVI